MSALRSLCLPDPTRLVGLDVFGTSARVQIYYDPTYTGNPATLPETRVGQERRPLGLWLLGGTPKARGGHREPLMMCGSTARAYSSWIHAAASSPSSLLKPQYPSSQPNT